MKQKYYKIELTDIDENLKKDWLYNNYNLFCKQYNKLIKQNNDGILWIYTGENLENLKEITSKRFYYTTPKETPKNNKNGIKLIFYILLYILITPFAIVLKLGKNK